MRYSLNVTCSVGCVSWAQLPSASEHCQLAPVADYLNEARNADRFAECFKENPDIRVPKVHGCLLPCHLHFYLPKGNIHTVKNIFCTVGFSLKCTTHPHGLDEPLITHHQRGKKRKAALPIFAKFWANHFPSWCTLRLCRYSISEIFFALSWPPKLGFLLYTFKTCLSSDLFFQWIHLDCA